jgi:hypothetical protein
VLVCRKAVVCTGFDEDRAALSDGDLFPFHLEDTCALEHDIDLVVFMGLLTVRLWSDQHVNAEFQPRRFVDDLVTPAGLGELLLDGPNLERVHDKNLLDQRAYTRNQTAVVPLSC